MDSTIVPRKTITKPKLRIVQQTHSACTGCVGYGGAGRCGKLNLIAKCAPVRPLGTSAKFFIFKHVGEHTSTL